MGSSLTARPYLNERLRLDTNREGADVSQAAFEFHTIRHSGKTEDACARGEEMAGVVIGVEPNEIAVEDTEENFAADGKDSEE